MASLSQINQTGFLAKATCKHEYRIFNSWYDKDNNYFRFYCIFCQQMNVVEEKKADKKQKS